jgi:hypothetical protein
MPTGMTLDTGRTRFEADLAGIAPQMGATSWGMKYYVEMFPDDRECRPRRWDYSPSLSALATRLQEVHSSSILDPVVKEITIAYVAKMRARARRMEAEQERREQPGGDLDWTA